MIEKGLELEYAGIAIDYSNNKKEDDMVKIVKTGLELEYSGIKNKILK